MCVITGGSSRMTRRPPTTAVSDSKAFMPSRRRAFENTASKAWRRRLTSELPACIIPAASACSRMSESVIDEYQMSERRMPANRPIHSR